MTDHDLDALLAAADPVRPAALDHLDLRPPRRCHQVRHGASKRVRSGRSIGLGSHPIGVSSRDPAAPGTAWAAPLVHLAESSPLLLVDAPGWHVTRADEESRIEGEMDFTRGTTTAQLNWRSGTLESWQKDRRMSAAETTRMTVLGAPAQVTRYVGDSGDYAAIWPDGGRVLELRSTAPDMASFQRLVGSLVRVDVDTWLSAMPASVIRTGQRAAVVDTMLEDVPLPPGFDRRPLQSATTVSDRYQLGAKVTGAVACAWIDVWAHAREQGDAATVSKAIAAMDTAARWKVLDEMASQGAFPDLVRHYAESMRHADAPGPLRTGAASGLGCGPASG